jgi:hypothetical protein
MTLTVTRETVLEALFSKLSDVTFTQPVRGKTGFVKVSRRLKHWADVPKYDRPCLFMVCHGESPVYRSELSPAYSTMSVRLFIYTDGSDKDTVPDTDLSTILDSIDIALAPSPVSRRQTLGGTVSHCRVEGEILREPGDMDDDGLLVIPISITTT